MSAGAPMSTTAVDQSCEKATAGTAGVDPTCHYHYDDSDHEDDSKPKCEGNSCDFFTGSMFGLCKYCRGKQAYRPVTDPTTLERLERERERLQKLQNGQNAA